MAKEETLTKLDKIVGDMRKQGKKYADWQKERYPVRAELPRRRGESYGKDNRY